MVLSIGMMQFAEAYDGNMKITYTGEKEPTNGTVLTYTGYLTSSEPIPNSTVTIKLLDVDNSVIDQFEVAINPQGNFDDKPDGVWSFEFEIDTGKYQLLTDTKYMLEAIYDNKKEDRRLYVYPTLEQSIIDSGNAQAERDQRETSQDPPEWVRTIFKMYGDGEINFSDLTAAIQYLIDMKIIKLS